MRAPTTFDKKTQGQLIHSDLPEIRINKQSRLVESVQLQRQKKKRTFNVTR